MCKDRTPWLLLLFLFLSLFLFHFFSILFCLLILTVAFLEQEFWETFNEYFLVLLHVLILGNYIVMQRDLNDLDFSCYKTYVIKTRLMTPFFFWMVILSEGNLNIMISTP